MKYLKFFKETIDCDNSNEVFEYLISTLKKTITQWDYFINWSKVFGSIEDLEIDLNTLNYLIGKENIEDEFKKLLERNPTIYRTIPALVACRQKDFKILTNFEQGDFTYQNYSFKYKEGEQLTDLEISNAVEFAKGMRLLDLFQTKKIKNCVDYFIGVEVGLGSNGRKNRGGKIMEDIVEFYVKDLCERKDYEYLKEATAPKVKEKWGKILTVDKSSRRIDFAIFNGKDLYLIETNFYTGGGSKLKATAGEYKTMFDYWKNDGHNFIWITDGYGWNTTKRPLEETFKHIDYILNLDMIAKMILEKIISGG